MRLNNLFSVVFVILPLIFNFARAEESHNHEGVDVFDEILKALQVTEDVLPTDKVESMMDVVFSHFTCSSSGSSSCNKTICISSVDIVNTAGGTPATGIKESEFENLATVLMFYMVRVNQYCKKNIDFTGKNLTFYKQNFTQSLISSTSNNATGEEQLEEFLETVNVSYVPGVHHEEESDHDHDHEEVLVFEEECLAADFIIDKFGNNQQSIQADHFGEIAATVLYHIFSKSQIKHKCRLLPTKSYFINELFEQYHAVNNSLSKQGFSEILTTLKIVSSTSGDPHLHAERKKRSLGVQRKNINVLSRVKREEEGHTHETEKTCFSAEQLLAIHDTPAPISQGEFSTICPALVYLITSESCQSSHSSTPTLSTLAERYGYSTLAVFLICLCSVLGAVLFPCAKDKCYSIFMAVFMGLAVGTLTTDAILHLLPEAFGIHAHGDDDGHDHSSGGIVIEEFVWYSIVAMSGIYVFFLMEATMGLLGGRHSHSHTINPNESGISPHSKTVDEMPKTFNHLAFMIIVGDAIHNFADGLAIGAGFTKSVTEGVGISLAVFCHELPHELGDFAVLLNSGMKFRNALFWNVFSSLTSFIGLYISLSVSENDIARQWIFAITAGMFIYIALVNIMPELARPASLTIFIFINIGILTGAAILIILSIFEGDIKV